MVINDRTKMLAATVLKLYRRGASANIQRILVKTHAADVAAVLESLAEEEVYEIFKIEPSAERRAQILSYLNPDLQKIILEKLSSEEASNLVTHMDSDDAADLLGQLPEEESKDIIETLEEEGSGEVVDLLGYPEDSAGGIMSSDYAAFQEDMTVEQVVQSLQSDEMESRVTFYVYVLNAAGHLVGVVSLKQLLLSKKSSVLRQLMQPNVISVRVDTDQEQVAQIVERYDFLSVPVVDENNKLVGVVTVDDVIDVIRREAQEDLLGMGQAGWGIDMTIPEHILARLPWQLLAFFAGAVCFALVYTFGVRLRVPGEIESAWAFAAFVPLLLALGAMVGNQAATVMVGAVQTGRFIGGRLRAHLLREMFLGVAFALLFSAIIWSVGIWWLNSKPWVSALSISMALQILLTTFLGSLLPLLMTRLRVDPALVTVPILTAIADVSAILILFGFLG